MRPATRAATRCCSVTSISYPESSVYRFLAGQQTIEGNGSAPWHDLAGFTEPVLEPSRKAPWTSSAIHGGGAIRRLMCLRESTG